MTTDHPNQRTFDLSNEDDFRWLADYFRGYWAVPMHLQDKATLVGRCKLLQARVTAHHRRDHTDLKWCEVCPNPKYDR